MNSRPDPFSVITTATLWTDPHISAQMLRYHLDPTTEASSRPLPAIETAVAWTTATFGLGPGSSVLDLGCGPGLYTSRWAATGADVTGVDFSARSIAYARDVAARDGTPVRYIEADYTAWAPDRTFDLVTMIYCDLSALGPSQRTAVLRSIRSCLSAGGAFLFDVHALPYVASRRPKTETIEHPDGGFWAPGPHRETAETILYPDEHVSLDRYTIEEPERTWTVWNWLQAYDPTSLGRTLAAAGFGVAAVLGDVAGRPYDPDAHVFAAVARPTAGG